LKSKCAVSAAERCRRAPAAVDRDGLQRDAAVRGGGECRVALDVLLLWLGFEATSTKARS
jgi:hypothetical protein